MYGDMIPLALSEQIFGFAAMFIARIYLAFLYAEAAAYLSSVHCSYSNHVRVRSTIVKYLELHNLPIQMKKRVYKYHEILWENFKGINENEIISDLPESIQKQIKFSLFSDLIKNVTLFPKDDKAAIAALISRLELQLISEGEYVIRDGEIATCMYFILRGSVNVIKEGVILATLEQGAHFGEMALAERKPTIRTASALCITPVSVGSLSITNFNIICNSYPIFESKISEEVDKRKKDLIDKTKSISKQKMSFDARKSLKSIEKRSSIGKRSPTKKKASLKSSNKGSRQSAYEVQPDAEQIVTKFSPNITLFQRNSKQYSAKSDLSNLNKTEKHMSANNSHENGEGKDPNIHDESNGMLIVKENPNDPDSAIIAEPNVYQGEVDNEVSEDSIHSKNQSDDSSSKHKDKTSQESSS